MRHFLGKAGRRAAVVAGIAVVVGAGLAYAAIPNADGTISACYVKAGGVLRVIDSEAGEECRRGEVAITLNQAARLACPEGTILSTGVCIEEDAREPALHFDAEDVCAEEGRRLPSGGELTTFAERDGITLASAGEWTDDVADVTRGSAFDYFVVADPGNGVRQASEPSAYRCVAGAGIG